MAEATNIAKKSSQMRWTEAHDMLLCREILLIKPYQFKPGSKESGTAWTSVSEDLNSITQVTFSTTQKSVRDRSRLLVDKYKKKMRQQEASSGTTDETTELDNLLENIKEESEVAHQNHAKIALQKDQNLKNDAESAQEIRQIAKESLSESRKRKSDSEKSSKNKRNNGSETMKYLVDRSEQELEIRRQELEMKKSEIELQRQQHVIQQQQMSQQIKFMNTMLDKIMNK